MLRNHHIVAVANVFMMVNYWLKLKPSPCDNGVAAVARRWVALAQEAGGCHRGKDVAVRFQWSLLPNTKPWSGFNVFNIRGGFSNRKTELFSNHFFLSIIWIPRNWNECCWCHSYCCAVRIDWRGHNWNWSSCLGERRHPQLGPRVVPAQCSGSITHLRPPNWAEHWDCYSYGVLHKENNFRVDEEVTTSYTKRFHGFMILFKAVWTSKVFMKSSCTQIWTPKSRGENIVPAHFWMQGITSIASGS